MFICRVKAGHARSWPWPTFCYYLKSWIFLRSTHLASRWRSYWASSQVISCSNNLLLFPTWLRKCAAHYFKKMSRLLLESCRGSQVASMSMWCLMGKFFLASPIHHSFQIQVLILVRPDKFEFTSELSFFDCFEAFLLHAFLPDPQVRMHFLRLSSSTHGFHLIRRSPFSNDFRL